MLDSTTVQFGWDPPSIVDHDNIRGVLKGYQVFFCLSSIENSNFELDRNLSTRRSREFSSCYIKNLCE